MELSMRFRINTPGVIHETIDDEVVIIEFDSGNYYSLDMAGAAIWGFVASGAAVGGIVEGIVNRYQGSRADIEDAVNRLIAEFQQEGLIVPDTGENPASLQVHEDRVESGPETERPHFEAPSLHKYTDMQDLLLLDPIHEVDEEGWPSVRPDSPDEDG